MKKNKDQKISSKRSKQNKDSKQLNDINQIQMINMAFNIVHKRMRDKIELWMNNEFEKKLNESVQKFVALEFKNEILPVLMQHIDKKLENNRCVTKQQVKECLKEIIKDCIEKLDEEGL